MSAQVRLEAVTKTYGAVRALVGISCAFDAGSVTVVSGPNGSGKSTLLAILGTLTRPTSGRVDHGALGRTRAEVRRSLGWVGHESLCYPDLSGRENIALAARLQGKDPRQAVARATDRLGLGAFADRPVRTYSRGQKQRISLARALVHDPALLLLDEPTAGLDSGASTALVRVILEEVGRGALVVAVTHDPSFARALSARIIALEGGRMAPPRAAPG